MMKWNVFAVAAVVTWFFLLSHGAPLLPVILGTALVALWNWRKMIAKS